MNSPFGTPTKTESAQSLSRVLSREGPAKAPPTMGTFHPEKSKSSLGGESAEGTGYTPREVSPPGRTAAAALLGQVFLGAALSGFGASALWVGVSAGVLHGGAWRLFAPALTTGRVPRGIGRGGTGLLLGGGAVLLGSWVLGVGPALLPTALGGLLGAMVSAWDLERERDRHSPFRRSTTPPPPSTPRPAGAPAFGALGARP